MWYLHSIPSSTLQRGVHHCIPSSTIHHRVLGRALMRQGRIVDGMERRQPLFGVDGAGRAAAGHVKDVIVISTGLRFTTSALRTTSTTHWIDGSPAEHGRWREAVRGETVGQAQGAKGTRATGCEAGHTLGTARTMSGAGPRTQHPSAPSRHSHQTAVIIFGSSRRMGSTRSSTRLGKCRSAAPEPCVPSEA